MFREKRSFFRSYRNIIIMVLLLSIFFLLGKMLFGQKSGGQNVQEAAAIQTGRLYLGQPEVYENLLENAIQQVFPASGLEGAATDGEGVLGSMFNGIKERFFIVDFKNPYTFIRSQFSAIGLYEQGWAASEENLDQEPNTEPVLSWADIDNPSNGSTNPPEPSQQNPEVPDPDDMGEAGEGIYIPNDLDVVDSLRQEGSLNLDQIGLPEKLSFEGEGPHILIYHTHGTESYQPATEGNYHSLRKEYSVIAVGDIITQELENQGFKVLHDTTYHDYPSYNGSYSRSISTVQEIMKKNPTIQVIFDVHRDGYDQVAISPNRNSLTDNNQATINGEVTTKFQLVIGSETPNRGAVETFAKLVKTVSDYAYPGFSKEILVKPYGKFNQYLVDHYALLEVGSNANTIEEAKRTGKYLGQILGEALKQISQ